MAILNYIKKHWRGELSLARSFWFNGILLTFLLILFFLIAVIIPIVAGPNSITFKIFFIATVVFLLVSQPLYIWQIVGIWRARHNHTSSKLGRISSILCQIIIALSLVHTVYSLPKNYNLYSSMLNKFYQGGFNGQIENNFFFTGKKYKIELLNNNESLYVLGYIQPGMANEIENLLKKHPNIKTIIINSPGGVAEESFRIVKLIQKYKLNTHSTVICASACTNIFVAGQERHICRNTKLGFHNPSLLNTVSDKSSDDFTKMVGDNIHKRFIKLCKKQNIDQSFMDAFNENVTNKTGDELWIPTTQETLDMNLAHSVVSDNCNLNTEWLYKLYEENADER